MVTNALTSFVRALIRKTDALCVTSPSCSFCLPTQADSRSSDRCGAAPTEIVVPYVFSNASLMRLPVSLLCTVTCTCSISICTGLKKKVSVTVIDVKQQTKSEIVDFFFLFKFSISRIEILSSQFACSPCTQRF